ncbi:MAG: FHA domain-containing protein [Polyangiaceae bacterium]
MRHTPVTWPRAELTSGIPTKARRFTLWMGKSEIALSRGELLLGRSRSCQVIVDDMLVSRHHARLLVSKTALFVEDLGSTNGIIVNESVIAGPTPLADGDRLIVGTQELLVRSADEGPETVEPPSPRTRQQTPRAQPSIQLRAVDPPATVPRGRTDPFPVPAPELRRESGQHPGFDGAETTQRTEKQDGLLTMARMADRMITMGRHDAAARLLGDHLRSVVAKAKSGQPVPSDVLETVGAYGLKLTEVTHHGEWANIAIELHLVESRPLPERAISALEAVLARVPSVDRGLILRYKAALRDASERFTREEQAQVERILKIPTR